MEPFDPGMLNRIKAELDRRERRALSPSATPNAAGVRRRPEKQLEDDYRQAFSLDADRILHSLAYTRYIDKTQVFYLTRNDHITHRVLHVQLVSKIARTIGRYLGLNQDLIEAVALGHDIGHTPFGHDGERFLSEICASRGIGAFHHNIQSVRFLDRVERKGRGWNLCLQTLDGILCHDGEIHNQRLVPRKDKTFGTLEADIAAKTARSETQLIPMTLEGCVVRMADTIAYIGRDIEDAIRLRMIDRDDIPGESADILGRTNGAIVFNLVSDIIKHSRDREHVAFSPRVSDALKTLKAFNLERIYLNPRIKKHTPAIRDLFHLLFETYLADIRNENRSSVIFTGFLENMAPDYLETRVPEEVVRDFIAGMTDQYFLRQCPEHLRPRPDIIP